MDSTCEPRGIPHLPRSGRSRKRLNKATGQSQNDPRETKYKAIPELTLCLLRKGALAANLRREPHLMLYFHMASTLIRSTGSSNHLARVRGFRRVRLGSLDSRANVAESSNNQILSCARSRCEGTSNLEPVEWIDSAEHQSLVIGYIEIWLQRLVRVLHQ